MRNTRPVWIAILALLGVLALLQHRWWMGAGGRREVSALSRQVQAQATANEDRRQRNDALRAEVRDLRDPASDGAAVEERARNELGMTRPDETFYRVVNLPSPPAASAAAAPPR